MSTYKVEICGVNTSKLPILKEEEKEELFKKIKAGDKTSRETYIKGNLRLVLSVIKRFNNHNENVDDLFQIGCIGLMKAIDNFDTSVGVKFSTYAVPMNVLSRNAAGDINMTRKQAILQAISILEKNKKNAQTVEVLKDIYNELDWFIGLKKSILDAFTDFLLENNRLPTKKDLCVNRPTLNTITRIFKVSGLIEFEKKYFYINLKTNAKTFPYRFVKESLLK